MLAELRGLFSAVSGNGRREDYAAAIVEDNCLGKPTASTRRLTLQRLKELYGLDPDLPIFRILRRLWTIDEPGSPLLALSAALARDPLLTVTAPAVLPLSEGAEFQRGVMRNCLQRAVGDRLNESILNKVVRNAASSWTQSGHLEGRTFKFRQRVEATPPTVAFGLYLGYTVGFRGDELFTSPWIRVLDCGVSQARQLAVEAKRLGLIDLRSAGDVVELRFERLDPAWQRI